MKKISNILKSQLKFFSKTKYTRLSNKSLLELNNMYFIFWLCSKNYFMNNINLILKFGNYLLGNKIFYSLVHLTLGRQFTAGQEFKDVQKIIDNYSKSNMLVAVNYMAEFQENMKNSQFDIITEKYIESMNLKTIDKEKIFTAIKFSAIVDYQLLTKINKNQEIFENIFKNSQNDIEFYASKKLLSKNLKNQFNFLTETECWSLIESCVLNINNKKEDKLSLLEWRLGINCYNINQKFINNPLYIKILNYTTSDLEELALFKNRLDRIINKAIVTNSYLLTDAEQSFLQLAIANITEQLMYIHNNNKIIIFQTYQNYLIQSNFEIRYEIYKKQLLKNYPLAIKLVRGAYMLQEREIEGKQDNLIIHKNKEQTDLNYNNNCKIVLGAIDLNSIMIVATHNEISVKNLLNEIKNNFKSVSDCVYFATLQGLNDNLAYDTLDQTSRVLKYLPYGEKEIMLPYLIRRGIESRELIEKDRSILIQIENELKNRLSKEKIYF